jgi:hypothetical protein
MLCYSINIMQDWIQSVTSLKERLSVLPLAEDSYQVYESQLSHFKAALCNHYKEKPFDISGYTLREVNPWRFFLLEVPEGFCLIEHILRNYGTWSPGQVNAALGLASSMSHSSDNVLADRARTIVQNLLNDIGKPTGCSSYEEYRFLHQYYFSLAQVEQKHSNSCETFIRENGISDNWLLLLNREYYESRDDSKTKQTLQKRLYNPNKTTGRDKHLSSVLQLQYEIVEKRGFVSNTFGPSKPPETKIIINIEELTMGDKFEKISDSTVLNRSKA